MSDFIVEAIQAAMKASETKAAEAVQVAKPPDAATVEKFNEIMATADIRPENQIVKEPTPTRVPFADRVGDSNSTVQKHQFFSTQLSSQSNSHNPYMITGKTIALTRWTFVAK